MPTKTMKKKIRNPVPADKTPNCPPHHWIIEQDGSAHCIKCRETRPVGTFVAWHTLLDAPNMNYSVRRGMLENGRAYYRPVEIFKI